MGDSTFQIQTVPPAIGYATDDVQPPSALAVTTNDQLVLDIMSDTQLAQVNIFARLLLPDSTIVPMQWQFKPTVTYTVQTQAFPMADGFLLSLVITSLATGLQRGESYVRVRVFRGSLGQGFAGLQLAAGYVTSLTPLAWPGGIQSESYSGYGNSAVSNVPAVPAGNEIVATIPNGALRHLHSYFLHFVASAAVANRFTTVQLQDANTDIIYEATIATAITAGQARDIIVSPAPYAGGTGGNILQIPWPPRLPMQPNWTITTVTTGLQAADQYTGILYSEEFLQP